jgi:serine/threonine protein kinase
LQPLAVALSTGTRLGPYEVTAQIGAGGMGEVYQARDTKLDRSVAIKILPASFVHDPDRLARFEREAKLLAALNHPNIAIVHGFEEAHGVRALVMELVEGPTLAERIASGPIPHDEALSIVRQVCEALEAAHEKGIVHRDLKPSNIKVTRDRRVKVLDFGLAKAFADGALDADVAELRTVTADQTRQGVILGTAAYMSPEQARGQSVDKRTDIWAFGCVLYEMLTGRRAFGGQTLTDTLAAVLEREPDWRLLPAATPTLIRRLPRRCLDKDSNRRLRDIGDARIDLDEVLSLPGREESALAPERTQALRAWRWVAILALLAFVTVVAWTTWAVRRPQSTAVSFETARMTAARLTSYRGRQYAAALAPDGRSFAFVSDHAERPDIWLRQVTGGKPVRLTNDALEEDDLAFAPDGESVYFTRVDDQGGESIWQIGILGGQARKVIANGHSPAPSPDGRTLAYMSPEQGLLETLEVSPLDGSEKRTLMRQVPYYPRVRPAWSRDGQLISAVRAGLFAPANLVIVDTRTGEERQVTRFTRPSQGIGQHVWLPDNRHLVVSYAADSSRIPIANDLAILNIDDGSLRRFTTAIVDNFVSPSLSTDGSRLIATSTGLLREVWKVPLKTADPGTNGAAAVRVIENGQDPMWSSVGRDGRTLLFNSPSSGSRNLWMMRLDGQSNAHQITAVSGNAITHSAMSPDGTRVAFVSFAGGASDIWSQNVDGTDLRQLTNDPAADSWPYWSPDGRSIAFTTLRDGVQQTWLVSADGTRPEKLIDGFFRGDWVEKPGGGTWIITSNNANRMRLIDVETRQVLWEERAWNGAWPMFSPDRRSISLAVDERIGTQATRRSPSMLGVGASAVATLDVATRKSRVIARLPFPIAFSASWVDNGTGLIVNRNDPVAHIVIFDRFWEPVSR